MVSAALLTCSLTSAVQAQGAIDVDRLPLSLERIQRGLLQSAIREEHQGLDLHYVFVVDVYGQAPPLVIFGPEDELVYGPVPYGAPTHKEMLEQITPREYRAPVADFSALLRWLAERARQQ